MSSVIETVIMTDGYQNYQSVNHHNAAISDSPPLSVRSLKRVADHTELCVLITFHHCTSDRHRGNNKYWTKLIRVYSYIHSCVVYWKTNQYSVLHIRKFILVKSFCMFCNFAFCQCVMMEAVSRVFCQVGGGGEYFNTGRERSFNRLGVSKLLFLLC